jgi:hypothetical protein
VVERSPVLARKHHVDCEQKQQYRASDPERGVVNADQCQQDVADQEKHQQYGSGKQDPRIAIFRQ